MHGRCCAVIEAGFACTLDKRAHFVESKKGPCPFGAGFRHVRPEELSTKWEKPRKQPKWSEAARRRTATATGCTSPSASEKAHGGDQGQPQRSPRPSPYRGDGGTAGGRNRAARLPLPCPFL